MTRALTKSIMSKTRSKLRTVGQLIGEKGEALFRVWATDSHLVPQKVERDYGIDFFCQVMEPVDMETEESTGLLIGVQVRSVAGKSRPRVVFDKADAVSALRLSIPYCLVAVDTERQQIYYKFLDERLLREFHSFIDSDAKTKSYRLSSFNTGAEGFTDSLHTICTPAAQIRLKISRTALKIEADVSGADLKVLQTRSGGIALVDVPWLTQVFQIDPAKKEEISSRIFEHDSFPIREVSGLPIKKAFESIKPLVDGPIVFRGAVEKQIDLFVRNGEETRTDSFCLRRVEDERAYVHSSGLILTISDARLHNGFYTHFMGLRISKDKNDPLGRSSRTLSFLELLKPGSVINEVGREGILVDHWAGLENIGPFVTAIQKVCSCLNLPITDVFLSDMQSRDFGLTITLIELMINQVKLEDIMPGFLLGPAAGEPPKDEFWVPVDFRIPIIANLKGKGVEIWVEGKGNVYVHDSENVICGFRITRQEKWGCVLRDTRFVKDIYPEVIVYENWPAIPLLAGKGLSKGWSFQGGIQHPLDGEIRLITRTRHAENKADCT